MTCTVGIVGGGRMGRGIALNFAFAGCKALIVDLKERSPQQRQEFIDSALTELRADLEFLAEVELIAANKIDGILELVTFEHRETPDSALDTCDVIFEGVPEVLDAKREAFSYVCERVPESTLIASTTSTILVNELAAMVSHPQRFMNANWLNPAHLMPLVEISRGESSSEDSIQGMVQLLESVGKVPVVCAATAGYIVPRLQCLAMNEATRMVEEGVASAEDIDKAVNVGFGLRFAVLGLLEFIDWGGGDILYYASDYLSQAIDPRYKTSDIVVENMKNGRNGVREGVGFFDYRERDVSAYRKQRMKAFIEMLRHKDLLPMHKSL